MTRPRRDRDRKMIGDCVLAERRKVGSNDYNRALHRLREIDVLIADRFGQIVPPTYLQPFLQVAAFCHPDPHATQAWVQRYAPYVAAQFDEVFEPVRKAMEGRRYNLNLEEAGRILELAFEERQRLHIVTMWAAGMPIKEQRDAAKEEKRKRDRERLAAKRGSKHKPRTEWLSEHQQRPWEAEGISKRTWYYRQKQGIAQVCRAPHKPIAQVCRAPSAQVCRRLENIGDVLQVGRDKRVQTPSIEPTMRDVSSIDHAGSSEEAGQQGPALAPQLDLFGKDDENG